MANLKVLDADSSDKYIKETGAGTSGDPHVPSVNVDAIAAGDNNIGNVDLASAVPAGTNLIGKVGIDQVTANANEVVIKSGTVTAVTGITNALPAGTNAIGKLAANSGVDIGDVDVTSVVPGTGETNLGKAVDAVAGASDVGVPALTVRKDTPVTLTPADGDYTRQFVDSVGRTWVHVGAHDAGENHLGEVGGKTTVTAITFSLDTNQYADGDVLADTQILAACLRLNDGTGVIQDVIFNDEDDQGIAFDVIVLNANTSLGTENSAPNISDANARTIVGRFSVTGADFYDLGGVRIANIRNVGIAVKGATGADDIYIGLISRGAGTYSASGITGYFKILCD